MARIETTKKLIEVFFNEYDTATGEHKDNVLKSFAGFIAKHNLLKKADEFYATMAEVSSEREGIPKASVRVQERMSKENMTLLKDKLKKLYNVPDVIVEETVDERILGGIEVKIKEKVYTNTIQHSIHQLQATLNNS